MGSLLRLVAVCALGLGLAGVADAQAPPRAEPDLPMLVDLPSESVLLRYAPGALDRAARLQFRFADLATEFSLLVKGKFQIQLYVLDGEEWRAAGFARPYGVAEITGAGAVALPAAAEPTLVELWRGLLGGALPQGSSSGSLQSPQGGGVIGMADLIGFVEAGHLLVERQSAPSEPWVRELLAHVAARLALLRTDGEDLSRSDLAFARLVGAGGGDGARRLADFRADLPLAAWLWYQAQFARGAALVLADRGTLGSRRLVRGAVQKGDWPAGEKLVDRIAGLRAWREAAFAR